MEYRRYFGRLPREVQVVILGTMTAVLSLCSLELLARSVVTVQEDLRPVPAEWYRHSSSLGWERRESFTGTIKEENLPAAWQDFVRRFDARGYFLDDAKKLATRDRPVVVALGDSNTFGFGTPYRHTYSEVLNDSLPNISVVNLGINGYTSYQGYTLLAQRLDELAPRVVIVAFGFNDRRRVNSPELADSETIFQQRSQLSRTQFIATHLYTYRLLQSVLTKVGLVRQEAEFTPFVDVRKAAVRVSPERYRDNLRKIAQLCRSRNIAPLFLLLGDNPVQTEHLRTGLAHMEHHDYIHAEREFRIAINLDNAFSELARKYLAELYRRLGRDSDADTVALVRTHMARSEHGGPPIYLDSEYHDIMREVAHEYGAILVDAMPALGSDPSVFIDFCHPDSRGHHAIALILRAKLEPLLADLITRKELNGT